MKNTVLNFTLAALLATAFTAWAADYYVSPGGTGDGSSWASPLATVEDALDLAAQDAFATVWLDADASSPVTHAISRQAQLQLASAITLRGRTGNPADCILTRPAADNTAKVGYRILYLNHASATVKDITIAGGRFFTTSSDSNGANAYINNGTIEHCIIRDGDTSGDSKNNRGAGFYMANGRVTRCIVANNKIKDNAYCYGSGGLVAGGTIDNCLFTGNSGRAGALRVQSGSPKIYNCTIAGNSSYNYGGLHINGGTPDIRNCLIADNTSTSLTDPVDLVVNSAKASYLKGCFARVALNADCATGTLAFRGTGDWRPIIGSASIDSAKAVDAGWGASDLDLQGNPRIVNGAADIGCYEWSSATAGEEVTFAAVSARGDAPFAATLQASVHGLAGTLAYLWNFGDGSTAETATSTAAHTYSTPGVYTATLSVRDGNDVVHAAANTLEIVASANTIALDGTGIDLSAALTAVNPGGEIILAAAGSPYSLAGQLYVNKAVTIRGATGTPADVVVTRPANNGKRPYRLFELNHASAVLRDLTVSGGSLSGSSVEMYGANILISSAGGTVSNCVIRNASTSSGNHRCGGICIQSSSGLATHCVITNNTLPNASYTGGSGAYVTAGRIDNCLIAGNTGKSGALYISGSSFAYNCTIARNTSDNCAGVYLANTSPRVANCIIYGNTGNTDANGVYSSASYAATVFSRCVLPPAVDGTVNNTCIYDSPDFLNSSTMDFHTSRTSCNVGQGDNTLTGWTAADTDLDGNPRLDGEGRLDIGCYQWTASGFEVTATASPVTGFAPLSVTFTPHVEGATGAYTCSWDFDGDGVADDTTSGDAAASHTFAAGVFSATLTVTHGGIDYPASAPVSIRAYPRHLYATTNRNASCAFPYDTPEKAATNLHEAVAAAGDGSVITLAPGTYSLSRRLDVADGTTLSGATGNPEDVRLRRPSGSVLTLDHARAAAHNLTVENATGSGGNDITGLGISLFANGGTVSNCIVRNIFASSASAQYCAPIMVNAGLITHCVVTNNAGAAAMGMTHGTAGVSAIMLRGGTLAHSLVAENYAIGEGTSSLGPVCVGSASVKILNCTIAGNRARTCGGVNSSYAIDVAGCIIAGNKALNYAEANTRDAYAGSPAFTNCVSDAVSLGASSRVGDLRFKNPALGDYRLSSGSAAINAADASFAPLPALDLAGKPRLHGSGLDAGCYEFQGGGTAIFVR